MSAGARSRTRSRTFTWADPAAMAQDGLRMPGIEYLRGIVEGTLEPPPVAELLGLTIVEVQEGRAVFAVDPQEWMYNPIGGVHGGIAATVLDSCMGCAIHTTLEAGVGYTTTDLHVRYIRAMTHSTARVLAEGRVIHTGRRTATADARMFVERDGSLIAHATTGCAILR